MSKDYSNIEGLIGNVKESIRNAYDKGYKQGFNEGFNDGKAQGRNEGLFEAWECARKIALRKDEARNAFHDIAPVKVFEEYSASEAIAKIKEYEEKQKQADSEIKVGDEVGNAKGKYIITKILSHHYANVMATDGGMAYIDPTRYKKTGRTFPQIAEVVEQLKEEQDETK